jgi:hypothetical protein
LNAELETGWDKTNFEVELTMVVVQMVLAGERRFHFGVLRAALYMLR